MFLKEKWDGTIKSRGCMDDWPQRLYNKRGASSLIVSLEAMILACIIDSKESRYVMAPNMPGAFLHADMEDILHILFWKLLSNTIQEFKINNYDR